MADRADPRARGGARARHLSSACALSLTRVSRGHAQVGNPLLVRLCSELREAMEPKVTVQSVGAFEGKVWE